MIQAVRYAPMVAARGGQVIVQCQPSLAGLIALAQGVDEVAPTDAPLPGFDTYAALFDLPAIFGTDLDSIPADVPYIDAPFRIPPRRQGPLKVGLAWAGNPSHQNDRNRSCGLEVLLDLLAVPGARFFGLQVGPRAADIEALGCGALIDDLDPSIDDFMDTAREVQRLDLVITVDTALAHLAGALARPVWLLLPRACDWRWLGGRSDSPWYPSMTIYRQPAPGDWKGVTSNVAGDLARLTAAQAET